MGWFNSESAWHDAGDGAGHASISDDGSGNIVVASGQQILFAGDNTNSTPHIARQSDPDTGHRYESGRVQTNVGASPQFHVTGSAVTAADRLTVNQDFILATANKQTITAATDTIATANVASIQLGRDAGSNITLTSTPSMAAGQDGQIITLVFEGTGVVTIQDESVLAGSGVITNGAANQAFGDQDSATFQYRDEHAAWVQITNWNNN